jgi:thiosulfate/3-mercaptopyruvate sulfurtransferase
MLKKSNRALLSACLICGALTYPPRGSASGAPDRQMLVSTAWLQDHLQDPDIVVVFIGQGRQQFDAAHIPNARFIRLDELVDQAASVRNELPPLSDLQALFEDAGVSDTSRIVLCGEGGGIFAARAYFTLDYMGLGDRAVLLDGGMEKWRAEARPMSKQDLRGRNGQITPRPRLDLVITTAEMRDLSYLAQRTPEYAILDARPAAEYVGLRRSEGVDKAGHIRGARGLYWKKLVREPGSELLSRDELEKTFRDAGVRPEQTVVTYCRTGMQSSFLYFVAKYLGYRAAMYDGSVFEWVQAKGEDLVTSLPAGVQPAGAQQ